MFTWTASGHSYGVAARRGASLDAAGPGAASPRTAEIAGGWTPVMEFSDLVHQALRTLRATTHLGCWFVTRLVDGQLVVLAADTAGGAGPIAAGNRLRWEDSLCHRMVRRLGPQVAPDVARVPAYAGAPLSRGVGYYAGAPVLDHDGALLGILCGLDARPHADDPARVETVMNCQAALISRVLEAELAELPQCRRRERTEAELCCDELTHLPDRRAWGVLLQREEQRVRRYGEAASIVVVDVGHVHTARTLKRAVKALKQSVGDADVARMDGRQFGVLLADRDRSQVADTVQRLQVRLDSAGVRACVGWAARSETPDLQAAWQLADERMFDRRRALAGATR